MAESFPLYWPEGQKRTIYRGRSCFKQNLATARDFLFCELERLGAKKVIVSTNIPLRLDGLPRADASEPRDPGVAVYFEFKAHPMCFACDQYDRVRDNLYAIGKTIEALRGIRRWGASDMMERAFRGFAALPQAGWRSILGVGANATLIEAERAFREKVQTGHSDHGGEADMDILRELYT